MSLLDIKHYLSRVKVASLANLSAYFNYDAEMLRNMLKHWERKGCVRKCMKTSACGSSCHQCSFATTELYEWVV